MTGLALIFLGAGIWFYRALTQPRRDRAIERRRWHLKARAANNRRRQLIGDWRR